MTLQTQTTGLNDIEMGAARIRVDDKAIINCHADLNQLVPQIPFYLLHAYVLAILVKTIMSGFQKEMLVKSSSYSFSFWMTSFLNNVITIIILYLRYIRGPGIESGYDEEFSKDVQR